MSCHGCAKSFGFLTKEYGCEKCGFAFCSKCLVKKTCKNCSTSVTVAQPAPPVVLQEQLDKLENPNRSPIIVYTDSTSVSKLKRGLSSEDQELVNRLAKLKNETRRMRNVPSQDEIEEQLAKLKEETREMKRIPTQDEIEERLAKLRGVDPSVYKTKLILSSQPKSNVDAATDLVNQMKEEVAIDKGMDIEPDEAESFPGGDENIEDVESLLEKEAQKIQAEARLAFEGLKKDREIQERLKSLKIKEQGNSENIKPHEGADDSDDEMQASSIVERVLAEARLDLNDDESELESSLSKKAEDELPWCELCNEDAQLRCLDCDRDLYCRRCWKETHQDADLKRHRIESYQAPKE